MQDENKIFREEDELDPVGPAGREDLDPIEDPDKLLRIKNRVARYVRVFSTEGIPVRFEVDGRPSPGNTAPDKTVTITAAITEENVPAVIGTALHEAAHINWTDLPFFFEDIEEKIPQRILDKADAQGEDRDWIAYAAKTLLNIVEDRRIDHETFESRPGWRKYVEFRYKHWYFSDNINDNLDDPDQFDEEWGAYMFHVGNIFNPHMDLDALDGLRDIEAAIDLDNIDRMGGVRDAFEVAMEVMEIIIDSVDEPMEDFEKKEGEPQTGDGEGDGEDSESSQGGGSGDEDNVERVEVGGLDEDAEDDFNEQLDMIHGDEDREGLDEETAEELEVKENDDIDDVSVGGSGMPNGNASGKGGSGMVEGGGPVGQTDCRVIRSVSPEMIEQSKFCFSKRPENSVPVEEGSKLGKLLADKLKIRDERREWVSRRKRRGKLDGSMLAEIGFNSRLFRNKRVEEYEDAYIHMSLDASGSMSGQKWEEAMTCASAIATACDIIGNVQCQISARFTMRGRSYGNSMPAIAILYDSRRGSYRQAKKQLSHTAAGGSTPEGLCFEAIMDEILQSSQNRDAYFVNFSDGMPNFSNNDVSYGRSNAVPHTRAQVKRMERRADVEVLSYYIGSGRSDDNFEKMYGTASKFIDVTDINSVSRTLNNKLVEK